MKFVTLTRADGTKVVMDEAAVAYFSSTAPDPSQESLDRLLANSAQVRVTLEGADRGVPLGTAVQLDVSEPVALLELGKALRLAEPPVANHCFCHVGPTFELLSAAGARVGVLSVQHRRAIRWSSWKNDASLADGERLVAWLSSRGVTIPEDR
jgi:hypothetical protein